MKVMNAYKLQIGLIVREITQSVQIPRSLLDKQVPPF